MPSASSPAEGPWLLVDAACGPARVGRGRVGPGHQLEVFRRGEEPPRPQARELPGLVAEALSPGGPEELAGVAAFVGPGSFTGIKVGLAFARGFARARGHELVGIDGLAALALAAGPGERWAAVDALRGECFGRRFRVPEQGPPVPEGPMRRRPWAEVPAGLELVVDPDLAGAAPASGLRPEPEALLAAGLELLAGGGGVPPRPVWTRPSWAEEKAGG